MNWWLLSMFAFMATANAFILLTQHLTRFDYAFMVGVMLVQIISIHGLVTANKETLYISHIIYIASLILGSLLSDNLYIIGIIVFIMFVAKISVFCTGDCPYHAESERINYGAGCAKTIFSDNTLYIACLIVIVYRFRDRLLDTK